MISQTSNARTVLHFCKVTKKKRNTKEANSQTLNILYILYP